MAAESGGGELHRRRERLTQAALADLYAAVEALEARDLTTAARRLTAAEMTLRLAVGVQTRAVFRLVTTEEVF